MYVPMFDQIPKGHVRYCHDFVPVVAVRIHSHDSQALVSGKTNQEPCISGQQEKPAISEIIYSRTK
jgi:hypothetical protein